MTTGANAGASGFRATLLAAALLASCLLASCREEVRAPEEKEPVDRKEAVVEPSHAEDPIRSEALIIAEELRRIEANLEFGYVPGELIVRFEPSVSIEQAEERLTLPGRIADKEPLGDGHTWRVVLAGADEPHLLLERAGQILRTVDGIDRVNANSTIRGFQGGDPPYDPHFGDQWGLHNDGSLPRSKDDADIDAPEAWALMTQGMSPVVVVVLDSGIERQHEDLQANYDGGVDEVDGGHPDDMNGHGTRVAGIIAAVGDNALGVESVSRRARIFAARVLDEDASGNVADAVKAINNAPASAKVFNLSWGTRVPVDDLRDAICAKSDDALFVVSAGNEFSDNDQMKIYPAGYTQDCDASAPDPEKCDNIIVVTATNARDRLAGSANWGRKSVHLGAPGREIFSTTACEAPSPGCDAYQFSSGTSVAAPHVSGVAALVWQNEPELTVQQVKTRILDAVDVVPSLAGRTCKEGRLNAQKVLSP